MSLWSPQANHKSGKSLFDSRNRYSKADHIETPNFLRQCCPSNLETTEETNDGTEEETNDETNDETKDETNDETNTWQVYMQDIENSESKICLIGNFICENFPNEASADIFFNSLNIKSNEHLCKLESDLNDMMAFLSSDIHSGTVKIDAASPFCSLLSPAPSLKNRRRKRLEHSFSSKLEVNSFARVKVSNTQNTYRSSWVRMKDHKILKRTVQAVKSYNSHFKPVFDGISKSKQKLFFQRRNLKPCVERLSCWLQSASFVGKRQVWEIGTARHNSEGSRFSRALHSFECLSGCFGIHPSPTYSLLAPCFIPSLDILGLASGTGRVTSGLFSDNETFQTCLDISFIRLPESDKHAFINSTGSHQTSTSDHLKSIFVETQREEGEIEPISNTDYSNVLGNSTNNWNHSTPRISSIISPKTEFVNSKDSPGYQQIENADSSFNFPPRVVLYSHLLSKCLQRFLRNRQRRTFDNGDTIHAKEGQVEGSSNPDSSITPQAISIPVKESSTYQRCDPPMNAKTQSIHFSDCNEANKPVEIHRGASVRDGETVVIKTTSGGKKYFENISRFPWNISIWGKPKIRNTKASASLWDMIQLEKDFEWKKILMDLENGDDLFVTREAKSNYQLLPNVDKFVLDKQKIQARTNLEINNHREKKVSFNLKDLANPSKNKESIKRYSSLKVQSKTQEKTQDVNTQTFTLLNLQFDEGLLCETDLQLWMHITQCDEAVLRISKNSKLEKLQMYFDSFGDSAEFIYNHYIKVAESALLKYRLYFCEIRNTLTAIFNSLIGVGESLALIVDLIARAEKSELSVKFLEKQSRYLMEVLDSSKPILCELRLAVKLLNDPSLNYIETLANIVQKALQSRREIKSSFNKFVKKCACQEIDTQYGFSNNSSRYWVFFRKSMTLVNEEMQYKPTVFYNLVQFLQKGLDIVTSVQDDLETRLRYILGSIVKFAYSQTRLVH